MFNLGEAMMEMLKSLKTETLIPCPAGTMYMGCGGNCGSSCKSGCEGGCNGCTGQK